MKAGVMIAAVAVVMVLTPVVGAANQPQPQRKAVATTTAAKPQAKANVHRVAARPAPVQRQAARGPFLNCVQFVKQVSPIQLRGNGWQWWDNAAGLYARGQLPAPDAVMVFGRVRGMMSGHVAVVREVLSDREVLIDHANWTVSGRDRGQIKRNVRVVDVSARGDWSQVRVGLKEDADIGNRVYALRGFVYNEPLLLDASRSGGSQRFPG